MDSIIWEKGSLKLLDQTRLPAEVTYLECCDYRQVAAAIRRLQVRGAPAIGIAAAYGFVLGAAEYQGESFSNFAHNVREVAKELASTRPTAVNLFWALERMLARLTKIEGLAPDRWVPALEEEALAIHREDLEMNRQIGWWGNQVIEAGAQILTHCNAGALATGGYGTALGVIRAAHQAGKNISVYACETRPLLQGARLTAWELMQDQIPVTLIADNMAGYLLQQGKISLVVVGADRIAVNGDVANKIGTYSLAVLAHHHQVPFYIAAPVSTFDFKIMSGRDIPIEERSPEEICILGNSAIAPPGVPVYNPAFDITPSRYVTGYITDRGILKPPFTKA
ncbi:MAG: S-methyl-5-thioribose-1-phosphate isomerase [Bacillota bacterium]